MFMSSEAVYVVYMLGSDRLINFWPAAQYQDLNLAAEKEHFYFNCSFGYHDVHQWPHISD